MAFVFQSLSCHFQRTRADTSGCFSGDLEASSETAPFNNQRYNLGFLYIPALMRLNVKQHLLIQPFC